MPRTERAELEALAKSLRARAALDRLAALMGCAFPDCDRPHYSGGFCAGHYQQKRRGHELKPLRTPAGEGDKVQVSMPRGLREAAQKDAADEGVTESAWWKSAGEERLARKAKKAKSGR